MNILNEQCRSIYFIWCCRYGVTPFTPMKGLFIQGPIFISFFLAVRLRSMLLYVEEFYLLFLYVYHLIIVYLQITNMVEKVPSFKHGGAFWFTDLTTPDSMYIFPVLTALTFWITVEVSTLFCISNHFLFLLFV